MTPKDRTNTGQLLHQFNAESLGDGDLDAGANILAAMALTIANLQRPDSVVLSPDGARTSLGCSFVVSGAFSASLVAGHVILPLQTRQGSLSANVRDWHEFEERERERIEKTGRVEEEPGEKRYPALCEFLRPSICGESDDLSRCRSLLVPPPGSGLRELQERPLVFASASSPEEFKALMKAAHLGRPLLHVPLTGVSDCNAYAVTCNRVLDGCFLPPPVARSVRGELLVTDSGGALGDAVRSGGAASQWLSRMLWLSGDGGGPGFEIGAEQQATDAKLGAVIPLYRKALSQVWAERLNADTGKPAVMTLNFSRSQRDWIRFLQACEPSFPGITGALRCLPASLLYGLYRINDAAPETGGTILRVDDVMSFARTLATRMVNARALILRDSRRARIEGHARSIRGKLADGPLTVRELIRRSHRLTAAEAEEALEFLSAVGLAKRSDRSWSLVDANSPLPQTPTLTINV